MEQNLEMILKAHMCRVKAKLGLKFADDSFDVILDDNLLNDAFIGEGTEGCIIVRIQTSRFLDALAPHASKETKYEFNQMIEHCLTNIPRMTRTLAHTPPASSIQWSTERKKFIKEKRKKEERKNLEIESQIIYVHGVYTRGEIPEKGISVEIRGRTYEETKAKVRSHIRAILTEEETE